MQLRTKRRRSPRSVQKLLEPKGEREPLTVWLVARTGWLQDGQLMQLVRRQKLLERNRERYTSSMWLVARTGWLQDDQLMQLVRRLQGDELMHGSPHRLYQSLYQSLLAGVVGGSTASLAR